ncbi:MAG TPA: BlaI/MecI/CopY family transcriptional regulator [Candidatus Flavonifractor intestinipullorum]|uniref:BlaI/MecI/CopY family transcriptional regulator n=1 Tax=Candidatus Flavonifractor intestinipullorum TaxID=2838587 RepID=A0A9D2S4E2_9FIRM|nr:BlaI/MecI/CopY family transcriptional regulator [Candidatus Flavonifractor intestinipullorum]
MDTQQFRLSESEWRVMEVLWTAPATLMELVHTLHGRVGWAKSTVTTMVRRMEEKGLIRHEADGRAKRFYPAVERGAVAAAETDSLLSRVYHGSVNLLVSNLLERERLSRADLDALYALLDEKKEE